jgi:type IV pilus assembly protein PilF
MKRNLVTLIAVLGLLAQSACTTAPTSRSGQAPEIGNNTSKPTAEEAAIARAKATTELAAGYVQRAQYDVALEELGNAVKNVSNYAPAYGLYGLVYHALKDDTKAETNFQRAIGLTPDDPEIRTNYGWFLCRTKRELESVAEFDRAAGNPLYRTPELALLYAAQCSARVGKMQVAEQYYRRILSISPESPIALFGLIELSYRTGRSEETRNQLKTAMRLPQVPANILHIGVCVETRLTDRDAAASYMAQLKNRYPTAVDTIRAENGDCD